ncbi:ABC transporter permease [candidate division KSB1 bacterium]
MKKPPKLARWILSRISRKNYRDNITGDFEELFNEIYQETGLFSALSWYFKNIVKSLPNFLNTSIRRSTAMFRNYIKIAFRNINNQKTYSFINIAGLTIGLTCTLLIIIYINHELSFDRYHENANEIYRVVISWTNHRQQGNELYNVIPGIFKTAVTSEFPEVLLSTRAKTHNVIINRNGSLFKETNIRYADPDFLEIFSFPLLSGDKETALGEPFSLVLTQEMAEKYFGDEDPVGRVLNIDKNDYKITGVIENIPENSHFTFDFLASFITMFKTYNDPSFIEAWDSHLSWNMYILTQKNSNIEELEERINDVFEPRTKGEYKFHFQPLTDIHLHSKVNYDDPLNVSDIRYVYLLSAIASFIMLIACFNYINLSTARSVKRAKEVGIRRISGAHRINLIRQYFSESVLFVLFAFMVSIIMTYLLLPEFSELTSRDLNVNTILSGKMILGLFAILILVGILSGSYPALLLSSFKPINVISGILRSGSSSSSRIRSFLVVFQFMISVILIICTLVVYNQLEFIRNKDLGFEKDLIICGDVQGVMIENFHLFKDAIGENPDISGVYGLGVIPIKMEWSAFPIWEGKKEDEDVYFSLGMAEYNFIDFFSIEISEGRSFSKDFVTDIREAWILNETAVKAMGMKDPIGKKFGLSGNEPRDKIVGVVKDFHFSSLQHNVEPLALCLKRRPWFNSYAIKVKSENISDTIDFLEEKFKEFSPDYPFQYYFLDESVDRMYKTEQKLGEIFNIFTVVAILISCLGLFGLTSYTAEQRTKEVGVRKVLGASVNQIIYILSKEFVLWVVFATAFAFPIAYYSMNEWLNNFAYRVNIGLIPFLLAGGLVLMIALFTVSYQSAKTALINPVDSLKYE